MGSDRVRSVLGSIRLRTCASAVATVALVLGLAAPTLMAHLRDTVVANAQATAGIRANDAAALLRAGELPRNWYLPDDKTAFVQIVRGSTVVSGSSNAGTRPVAAAGTGWRTVRGLPVDPDAPFRVIDLPVHADGERFVVVAGSSMDDANDALAASRWPTKAPSA